MGRDGQSDLGVLGAADAEPATGAQAGAESLSTRWWGGRASRAIVAMAVLGAVALVLTWMWAWPGQDELGTLVGDPISAGRFDEARNKLQAWNATHPDSANAEFYAAWLALAMADATAAVQAVEQAKQLGLDRDRLDRLTAICAARSGQFQAAEPILRKAYDQKLEPRALIAESLARIYLRTYRLALAGDPIERWKTLAPFDPQPYMWSNEIASRSENVPKTLIRNYQAALERNPNLDEARLGLAKQLTKDGQFAEAEQEFQAYLKRKPNEIEALAGLGKNALEAGDLDAANQHYEAALRVNPRRADALKALAIAETRAGKPKQACDRYKVLVELEPYDFETRYSYSQALRLSGNEPLAREQSDLAAQLRKDNIRITEIRQKLIRNPDDVALKYEVARWMLEHGHETEAIDWTKEILRGAPRHAATHAMLCEYYQKRGEAGLANYHRMMSEAGNGSGGGPGTEPASR